MDAITSIQSRIADIQLRISSFERAVPTAGVLGTSAASASSLASSSASGFSIALATEQLLASGQVDGAVGTGKSQMNAQGVPLAYLGYGNGKVPSSALSTVAGTGAQLWAPAARSFEALRSAAAADGVTIGVTDSYRSYDAQVDVAARKGLYNQGGLAAVPGTSDHGWGTALDLKLDQPGLAWMKAHGTEYGFTADVPGESWHWHYTPSR